MTDLVKIQEEVNNQLADTETLNTLINITFKGLQPQMVKRAALEGMMRGFTFEDFLKKNIYAVPFGGTYSLVTSIDYARKIGQKSGIVGKSAPIYEEKPDGGILTCTITVKKLVKGHVGDFTETVYFSEYTTGKNLWVTKPRTMIAKVAEMHALRMACPEEMSQLYVEEEMQQSKQPEIFVNVNEYEEKLRSTKSLEELKSAWMALPATAKNQLSDLKEELKNQYQVSKKDDKKDEVEVVESELTEEEKQEIMRQEQEEFLAKEGVESIPL